MTDEEIRVVDLIDSEVSRCNAIAQRWGYNRWVLWAAIASVLWLSSGELKATGVHQSSGVLWVWLAAIIGYDLVKAFWPWLEASPFRRTLPGQAARVLPASWVMHRVMPRGLCLYLAARTAAVIVVVLRVGSGLVGPVAYLTLLATNVVTLILLVGGLLASLGEYRVLAPQASQSKGSRIVVYAGIGIWAVACVAYLSHIFVHRYDVALTALRVGGLVAVATIMGELLMADGPQGHLADALLDEKRDLLLRRITASETSRNVEMLLLGEDVEARLRDIVAGMPSSLESLFEEGDGLIGDMKTLGDDVSARGGSLATEDVATVRALLQRKHQFFERVQPLLKELRVRLPLIREALGPYRFVGPQAREADDAVTQAINGLSQRLRSILDNSAQLVSLEHVAKLTG